MISGGVIVLAGMACAVWGGYVAYCLTRRHQGARVLVCGIGFLVGAPSFAVAVTTHRFTVFIIFFVLTAMLLTIYTGPTTVATQDVVPSILLTWEVAVPCLSPHYLVTPL